MFLVSYAALSILIAVESYLIYAVMQADMERRAYREQALRGTWPGSLPDHVPDFEAPYVGLGGEFSKTELIGQRSALIFMSTSDTELISGNTHLWILARVRTKFETSHPYLICAGSYAACSELSKRFKEHPGTRELDFTTVWDEEATVTRYFGITKTPSVVAFDADGCVVATGGRDA
jgi:hypothetical protein